MSKGAKKMTLRSLFYRALEPDRFEALTQELYGGTDRSAALIGAAMVDASLETALRVCFVKFENDDTEHSQLFRSETAPISTLASKLLIARAIGLFSHDAYRALHVIQQVRNVFAHSFLPLKFTEPEIIAECVKLPEPSERLLKHAAPYPQHPLRLRYVLASALAAANLEGYAVTEGAGQEIRLRMTDDKLPTIPRPQPSPPKHE